MASTSPTRIDDELYAAAKILGAIMDRSASQQITHWARIGRELEAAPSVSHQSIQRVLTGRDHYDTLTAEEQALVRVEWAERMRSRIDGLDLAARFATQGRSYVELDDHDEVTMVVPGDAVIDLRV